MKVLFTALHFAFYRNYESVLRELAKRGHRVHVTADIEESTGGQTIVERLAAEYPGQLTWGFTPPLDGWRWSRFGRRLRRSLECVRFADPIYNAVPKYRTRTDVWTPKTVRALLRVPGVNTAAGRGVLQRLITWLEHGVPTVPEMDGFVEAFDPDVVVLSSVTNPEALQLDHMKSVMAAGRHAVISVWSWDHLSGKAWLKIVPERVFVWNDTQRDEAVDLHGIDTGRIVVTGAQCYDQWFDRRPSRDRETFCREVGLDPARPYILYVCSVLSRPAPPEAPFVREWIRRIRTSDDPRLREAGLLIRPHPERMREWRDAPLDEFENVGFRGAHPINAEARADYFDAMYHSAAVMGIVTSASVEAAVVGRPNYTIQLEEFREHQEQSPHFHHLMRAAGGLLHSARTFEEHLDQLASALRDPATPAGKSRTFVAGFVRPRGLDVRATDVFVDELLDLAAKPRPVPATFGRTAPRIAAGLLRAFVVVPGLRWFSDSENEARERRAHQARVVEEREIKKQRLGEKAVKRVEKQVRVSEKDARRMEALQRKANQRAEKAQIREARERYLKDRERRKRRASLKGRLKQLFARGTP